MPRRSGRFVPSGSTARGFTLLEVLVALTVLAMSILFITRAFLIMLQVTNEGGNRTVASALAVRRFARPAPCRTIALVWRKRSPMAAPMKQLAAVVRQAYPTDILPRPWRKSSRER